MGLPKLLESKINDSKHYPRSSLKLPQPSHHLLPPPRPFPTTRTPTPSPLIPIKKTYLCPTSKASSCWLCYNCDEKFIPGRKCTTSRFLLLLSEEYPSEYILEPYSNISHNPKSSDNPTLIHFYFQAYLVLLPPIPLNLKITFLTSLLVS